MMNSVQGVESSVRVGRINPEYIQILMISVTPCEMETKDQTEGRHVTPLVAGGPGTQAVGWSQ